MENHDLKVSGAAEDIQFIRGFLVLLKETDLFGPMVDMTLESLDRLADRSSSVST